MSQLKNGLPRKLALNDIAKDIIERNSQNKEGSDFLFQPKAKRPMSLRNIIYKRGKKPITKQKYCFTGSNFFNDFFRPVIEKYDLKPIGLHGLRHTYAAMYMMNGGELYELKSLLGHKSIKTTEIYAHLSPEYLAKSKDLVRII